jgi:hypothetical protein
LEVPVTDNALIEHQAIGASRNLLITTTGDLRLTSDTLNATSNTLSMTSTSVGGTANPLLLLQNNNNTAGGTTIETYKNDTPTSTGGDVVGIWSATCNTIIGSVPTKTEISRISQIAYGVGASNNDGGIVLACKVNSSLAPTNFLACNGGAGAGEVQIFRPITNPTGDITVSTTSSSGTGDVNITAKRDVNIVSNGGEIIISTASSTGSGDIDITGKSGSITTLTATLINLNSTSADVNLNSNVNVGLFAGTDIDATATTGDINLTSTAGDVNIISNGAGKSINLTSVSSVDITATGDNLALTAGATLLLDSNDLRLTNSNVVTTTPNHTSALATTSNIADITTYLKVKLNNADIWIPYFTVDPNV